MEIRDPIVMSQIEISRTERPSALHAGSRSLWHGISKWLRSPWIPPRIQAFEFCDQRWLHGVWREAYMDGLSFLFKLGGVYRGMHVPYGRWAAAAGHNRVLDLASGNGGPAETILASAQENRIAMPMVVLSDLYPDLAAFQRLKEAYPGRIDYAAEKTDAIAAPARAELVSICTAFHHFPPDLARKFMANVGEGSEGIFITEVFSRNLLSPLLPLLNLFPLMVSCFFARRLSWRKIAITALVPIIPLMIMFDGIVSALRSYRAEEILEMVPEAQRREWQWESGSRRYLGVFGAPFLFGFRRKQ